MGTAKLAGRVLDLTSLSLSRCLSYIPYLAKKYDCDRLLWNYLVYIKKKCVNDSLLVLSMQRE